MVDLETLGLGHDCPIVQIGACTVDLTKRFQETVIPVGTSDPETLAWWDKRGGYPQHGAIYLREALERFNSWVAEIGPEIYWANDPQQDLVWLESAYLREGIKWPWKHNNTRSYRTVRWLANNKPEGSEPAHGALADCLRQSELLRWSLNLIL